VELCDYAHMILCIIGGLVNNWTKFLVLCGCVVF